MIHFPDFYADLSQEEIKEKIIAEGFDPIVFSNTPGFVYHKHSHKETKLLAFLSGTMTLTVENETFVCKAGDKVLIPGNLIHAAVVGPEGCTFFWSEKVI